MEVVMVEKTEAAAEKDGALSKTGFETWLVLLWVKEKGALEPESRLGRLWMKFQSHRLLFPILMFPNTCPERGVRLRSWHGVEDSLREDHLILTEEEEAVDHLEGSEEQDHLPGEGEGQGGEVVRNKQCSVLVKDEKQ